MPNITFEYTANLKLEDVHGVINSIHKILAENLPTDIENCKTAINKLDNFIIGNSDSQSAFIRMDVYVMPGRSEELKLQVTQNIIEFIRSKYQYLYEQFDLQVSASIIDLTSSYVKVSNKDL